MTTINDPFTVVSNSLNNTQQLRDVVVTGWMPSAPTRGTTDILWTCTATITLCVWTAVHLNIPAPDDTHSRRFWRKVKWTVVGLLAPEIVLFTAWEQLSKARSLVAFLNKEFVRQQAAGKLKDRPPRRFTLKYGYFVCMGGLRMRAPEFDGPTSHVPLSASAIRVLAQAGSFLDIEDSTIQDHSKTDGLAKTLICLQILWLSVECVARKVYGLPLSTLEIHTFVHVVCSPAVYILWLQKPLDIAESTIVNLSDDEHDLMSLLEVSTRFRSFSANFFFLPNYDRKFRLWNAPTNDPWGDVDTDSLPSAVFGADYQKYRGKARKSGLEHEVDSETWNKRVSTVLKDPEWQFHGTTLTEVAVVLRHSCADRDGFTYHKVPVDEAHSLGQATLRSAVSALNRNPDVAKTLWERDTKMKLRNRIANLSSLEWGRAGTYIQLLTLTVYGAVHLTAWNSHFPTQTEQWLWRSSAIFLAGTAVISPLVLESVEKMDFKNHLDPGNWFAWWILFFSYSVGLILLFLVVFAGGAAYMFARFFLVIESFIGLRSVPAGVYALVPWSNYIPHI